MKTTYIYLALVIVLLVGLVFARNHTRNTHPLTATSTTEVATPYDSFAQCIADAGAKFYGAYWCPHCQAQKKLFQNSKKLPYVECSTPNAEGQNALCNQLGIKGYPTWIFADGSRGDGEQTFADLSAKTGCKAPEGS